MTTKPIDGVNVERRQAATMTYNVYRTTDNKLHFSPRKANAAQREIDKSNLKEVTDRILNTINRN